MDNREILLDKALLLFSQRGYDAVGVQEIVDAVGVTKPTMYHYFESKRGLLDALVHREEGRILKRLWRESTYEGDLVLSLERIVSTYFNLSQEQKDFYRLQMAMVFAPPESESNQAIKPYINQQISILENIFIQAAAGHGNLIGKHKQYASGLLGLINAMIGLFLNNELALTDQLVYQLVHQFMYGIFS